MPFITTTIGSYPKPDFVPTPDYFRQESLNDPGFTRAYDDFIAAAPQDLEEKYVRGAGEIIADQLSAGIDILTDGEVRRDSYIHYHCRHLTGFDFRRLTPKVMRSGSWEIPVPTITGPVTAGAPFLVHDWKMAQSLTKNHVKMTIPGPMTIIDSTFDAHYGDEPTLARDLAEAINVEVRALAQAGCVYIQIDEPVFARYPEKALAYGIENLERCFDGVPEWVVKIMHMCCGYPDRLDNEDYPKADPEAYFRLAPALDASAIQQVSIEDAHRHNDLSLLERFGRTSVILGVVAIARSRVEPPEEIRTRAAAVLEHIDPQRLLLAPDCGLGMLPRRIARAKMQNLVRAARME
jgi:5-methyltetrahydropteroyltriglutamate--homocysteine methyltransferase